VQATLNINQLKKGNKQSFFGNRLQYVCFQLLTGGQWRRMLLERQRKLAMINLIKE